MLCYVMLYYVMLCYVMLCYGMLWYGMYVILNMYVMLCYIMLRCVTLCYVILYYGPLRHAVLCLPCHVSSQYIIELVMSYQIMSYNLNLHCILSYCIT